MREFRALHGEGIGRTDVEAMVREVEQRSAEPRPQPHIASNVIGWGKWKWAFVSVGVAAAVVMLALLSPTPPPSNVPVAANQKIYRLEMNGNTIVEGYDVSDPIPKKLTSEEARSVGGRQIWNGAIGGGEFHGKCWITNTAGLKGSNAITTIRMQGVFRSREGRDQKIDKTLTLK
jgi:hypothetical protein